MEKMTMGQRIAQKRKEQNLSQEALGEALGVSRQSISKWESDTSLPEIEKLVALSKLFGVSVGWLLGVEEEPPRESGGELTEEQLKLVEEIVGRYIAAQPKPMSRRRKRVLKGAVIVAACCFTMGLFWLSGQLTKLENQYNSLQNSVGNISGSVNSQINSIGSRVEEILQAQNSLPIRRRLDDSILCPASDGGAAVLISDQEAVAQGVPHLHGEGHGGKPDELAVLIIA